MIKAQLEQEKRISPAQVDLLQCAKDWRQRGQSEQIFGRKIFVIDTQDKLKPVLLLIHGFPTSSWDWHFQFDTLAQTYRVVAIDMLGFGFSEKPQDHRYTILEQADLHQQMLRDHRIDQYSILAHDYGDTVAQELLARQLDDAPAKPYIKKVLFLNGGLFPETHRARPMQKLLLGPFGSVLVRLFGKGTLAKNLTAVFGKDTPPSDSLIDAFWYLITLNQGHRVLHRLMAYMTDRKEHRERWLKALQESQATLGMINGSVDPVSGRHMVERYNQLVGRERIVELPKIGHYPQVEAPDEVLLHTQAFLQERNS